MYADLEVAKVEGLSRYHYGFVDVRVRYDIDDSVVAGYGDVGDAEEFPRFLVQYREAGSGFNWVALDEDQVEAVAREKARGWLATAPGFEVRVVDQCTDQVVLFEQNVRARPVAVVEPVAPYFYVYTFSGPNGQGRRLVAATDRYEVAVEVYESIRYVEGEVRWRQVDQSLPAPSRIILAGQPPRA